MALSEAGNRLEMTLLRAASGSLQGKNPRACRAVKSCCGRDALVHGGAGVTG